MIDPNKPLEGIDYVIAPFDAEEVSGWVVDVIGGPFRGQRILYNQIAFDGPTGKISFNYLHMNTLEDTRSLQGEQFEAFDQFVFDVLVDVIKNGIANGSVVIDDKDSVN